MTSDNTILEPKVLVIPKITEAVRDTLVAEEGTLIYNLDTNKLNVCDVDRSAGAGSWAPVTSG
jgi:hypothetical protein